MYTTPFPWLLLLTCSAGMAAIAFGVMLMITAGYDGPAHVKSDRNGGVRFILAGIAILLAVAIGRLF